MKHLIEQLDRDLDWRRLPELASWTVERAVELQQIPAPTFDEARRADHVMACFKELGLTEVSMDDIFNVYGLLPGASPDLPGVMISAHTDTVFPGDTNLKTRVEGSLIYGPGLGDNCMGVAGLMALVETLRRQNIVPECNLWFVATSREEGLGDLGGMKAAFQKLRARIGSVINLEGLALGYVYHAGIAFRRLRINAFTAGGHSWLHFGRASAIHGMIELGGRITAIRPAQIPRTTYNIGMIEGGQAINAIASRASMWLDMRSEDRTALETLEQQIRGEIQATTSSELQFGVEVVGDRPAGYLSPEHPLVQNAMEALGQVGVRGLLETGSTDGNVPLAENFPAVTVGITRGGNAHRLDEFIETEPVATGLRHLMLLTLAAANQTVMR